MAKAKNTSEAKQSPLDIEMEKIEKQYGKGTMVGDNNQKFDIIPSGSLKYDIASGIGGYARGKVYEFMGWESCGKSTATLHAIAEAQKLGLNALLIDGEQSFEPDYAIALGVNTEKPNLHIYQMDDGGGEKAYDIAMRLIKTAAFGIVIIDSQTALIPKKVFDDPSDASNLGLHARLMSRVVPQFLALAASYNVCVIIVSQFREKIGVMYGSPETTNGGNALKMYAHVRLTFRKTVINDADKNAVATKVSIKMNKNKLARPYNSFDYYIQYGEGIDRVREIFDVACEMGIITVAGSWYSYGETSLGQGEDKIIQMLKDNSTYADNLENKIRRTIDAKAVNAIIETATEVVADAEVFLTDLTENNQPPEQGLELVD